MERVEAPPAKRVKSPTVDFSHSADLVDICSEMVAIKVGGDSAPSTDDGVEESDSDDGQQEVTEGIENSGTDIQTGENDKEFELQATATDPGGRPMLEIEEGPVDGDPTNTEIIMKEEIPPANCRSPDDVYYMYHTDSEYNSESDSDYVYEEAPIEHLFLDLESDDTSTSEYYPEKIFQVHKSVLCQTSKFFQTALKPRWTAQRKKPIDLSEDDPAIFALYVQWLYTSFVAVKSKHEDSDEENDAGPEKDNVRIELQDISYRCLVKCYVLGEKLMDSTYQNAIMNLLLALAPVSIPSYDTIRIGYNGTTIISPLRKLFVDIWVWCAYKPPHKGDLVWQSSPEFANDLIHALLAQRNIAPIDEQGKRAMKPPWDTKITSYYLRLGDEEQ